VTEPTSTVADSLAAPPPVEPVVRRARPRWPGILSFVLALLAVAGVVAGIILATSDLFLAATYTAWAAIAASGLAALLGLIAVIAKLGRGWGTAGLVLGVVANPYLLTIALDRIGGLWA
jgi:uncharacterized membrane protein YcjF (UPF0283 family)